MMNVTSLVIIMATLFIKKMFVRAEQVKSENPRNIERGCLNGNQRALCHLERGAVTTPWQDEEG